jgi:hypothetical protein
MSKALMGLCLGLGLYYSTTSSADPVIYTVSGNDHGTPFTVNVTIPEGQVTVNYGGSVFAHNGINLSHSSSSLQGSEWKVETIQNVGDVNQLEVHIGAYNDHAGILDPHGVTGGFASVSWGVMYLHIPDRSIFTNSYLTAGTTTFSKSIGTQQLDPLWHNE